MTPLVHSTQDAAMDARARKRRGRRVLMLITVVVVVRTAATAGLAGARCGVAMTTNGFAVAAAAVGFADLVALTVRLVDPVEATVLVLNVAGDAVGLAVGSGRFATCGRAGAGFAVGLDATGMGLAAAGVAGMVTDFTDCDAVAPAVGEVVMARVDVTEIAGAVAVVFVVAAVVVVVTTSASLGVDVTKAVGAAAGSGSGAPAGRVVL